MDNWLFPLEEDVKLVESIFGDSLIMFERVGSRVTSSVVREDSDHDYLILVSEVGKWMDKLYLDNPNTHYRPEDNQFNSWRGEGNRNFIVTFEVDFYMKFVMATIEAKKKNLTTKEERVDLFQKRLYGVDEFEDLPF